METDQFRLWCISLWILWRRRNDIRFNQQKWEVERTKLLVDQTFRELDHALEHQGPTKWKPPTEGVYKLNVDAAQAIDKTRVGIGAVIRDSNGDLIAALARNTRPVHSVFVQKMVAIREGLQFAREIGISYMVIEIDAYNVFSELKESSTSFMAGHIVEEILFLTRHLKSFSWSFTGRKGNAAAHSLAKHALVENHDSIWVEECPTFLLPVFVNDAMS